MDPQHGDRIARWNGQGYADAGPYTPSSQVPDYEPLTFIGIPLHDLAWGLLVFFLLLCLLICLLRFTVVNGNEAIVLQRFGVPNPRPRRAGIFWRPFFTKVVARIDLKQRLEELTVTIVTQDQVNGQVKGVVRYVVQDNDAAILNFIYKMDDPITQLMRRVENEMRQIISGMPFFDLYGPTVRQIAEKIIEDQRTQALETGLEILDVIIEQPTTSDSLQNAMNNKLVATLYRDAATAEGEAETIKRVAIAKADKESKKLQGEGIAAQREAVVEGLTKSMKILNTDPETPFVINEDHLLTLLNKTIDADMVTTAALTGKSVILFFPIGTDPSRLANLVNLAPPHIGHLDGHPTSRGA